jgi:protein transport protein SEC24
MQAHLYVVREDGDPSLRQWALSLLIEDRMDQLPSYNQWIGQLKDKVRCLLPFLHRQACVRS